VKIPELAFRIPRAVFADAIGLVEGLLDDLRADLDAAGVVGVGDARTSRHVRSKPGHQ
jgi:hypothetical protein